MLAHNVLNLGMYAGYCLKVILWHNATRRVGIRDESPRGTTTSTNVVKAYDDEFQPAWVLVMVEAPCFSD